MAADSKLVSICLQRGVVTACWDNAGVRTDILIHPSYDHLGQSIPNGTISAQDGTTETGLIFTDVLGNVLIGVDVADIRLGSCANLDVLDAINELIGDPNATCLSCDGETPPEITCTFEPSSFAITPDGALDGNESGTFVTDSGDAGTWAITNDFSGGNSLSQMGISDDGGLWLFYGGPNPWQLNGVTLSIVPPVGVDAQLALYGYMNADTQVSEPPGPDFGSAFDVYTLTWDSALPAIIQDPANQLDLADGAEILSGDSFTQTSIINNDELEWFIVFPVGATEYTLAAQNGVTREGFRFTVVQEVCTETGDGGGGTTPPPDYGTDAAGALVSDNFQDGAGNAPFNLQVRNTTGTPTAWRAVISARPYATIPSLTPGDYTYTVYDLGDGTYDHVFESTVDLGAFANTTVQGGLPVPPGDGTNLTFYIP